VRSFRLVSVSFAGLLFPLLTHLFLALAASDSFSVSFSIGRTKAEQSVERLSASLPIKWLWLGFRSFN
jgi:hypothetical protein